MRVGYLDVQRSEDGLIERYRIKSTVYKRRDVRGQAERWITIEPVAKAITVVERLTSHIRRHRGGDTLWRVLAERRDGKDHISAEIVRQLNAFRDYLNAQFGTPEAPIIPPGPDGKPWRITTRQFRRTVAWHIANRPFGTVAGMIQYKHASIAAYEGYAGSSRSGFRTEVERERALGQLDDPQLADIRPRTTVRISGGDECSLLLCVARHRANRAPCRLPRILVGRPSRGQPRHRPCGITGQQGGRPHSQLPATGGVRAPRSDRV
jgi:hypothetical protein